MTGKRTHSPAFVRICRSADKLSSLLFPDRSDPNNVTHQIFSCNYLEEDLSYFCSTRKGAQEAAQQFSQTSMTFDHSNPFIKSREQQERLRETSLSCSDKQMQSYIL